MMECILSTAMSSENITEPTELANCSHEKTKKARKFGEKCALCQTRVWKFWKTRKCLDCKCVLHKSCAIAWKKENGRDPTVKTTPPVQETAGARATTSAETASWAERTVGDGLAPLYVTPAPWILENVTAVIVDCRGRPRPLTVVVGRGLELSAAMFAGLFDALPARCFAVGSGARDAGDERTVGAAAVRCVVAESSRVRRETDLSAESAGERSGRAGSRRDGLWTQTDMRNRGGNFCSRDA